MIDITVQNIKQELIEASMQQPVLLDIWAPWCGPCKALSPVLEGLEVTYAGRFKLAKLNADEQPEIASQLSQMMGVRSIPFCVMFSQGQPIDGFVGALPEAEIRQFLDRHVPSAEEIEAQEDMEEAEQLLACGDTEAALERLQEAVALNPTDHGARYEWVRALIQAGQIEQAQKAYEPVRQQPLLDARLVACGHWLQAIEASQKATSTEALQAKISENKRDFAARFELAQLHFSQQRLTASLDELLEIIMRDKSWNNELARKTFVAILELMTPTKKAAAASKTATPASTLELTGVAPVSTSDPVVDGYRRKLSMALF
jgi:putative thioredoxin